MFCNVFGREVDSEAVVEKRALEDEVNQGVEGVPDEEDTGSGTGSFRESESRYDVGCNENSECCRESTDGGFVDYWSPGHACGISPCVCGGDVLIERTIHITPFPTPTKSLELYLSRSIIS